MRNLNIDMWYGDSPEDADKIDVSFCPNGKFIGDYWCRDSLLLERVFPQLTFSWR